MSAAKIRRHMSTGFPRHFALGATLSSMVVERYET